VSGGRGICFNFNGIPLDSIRLRTQNPRFADLEPREGRILGGQGFDSLGELARFCVSRLISVCLRPARSRRSMRVFACKRCHFRLSAVNGPDFEINPGQSRSRPGVSRSCKS